MRKEVDRKESAYRLGQWVVLLELLSPTTEGRQRANVTLISPNDTVTTYRVSGFGLGGQILAKDVLDSHIRDKVRKEQTGEYIRTPRGVFELALHKSYLESLGYALYATYQENGVHYCIMHEMNTQSAYIVKAKYMED